jgi:hypothetical protein
MFVNRQALSPSLFSGGDETNSFLRSRGFKTTTKVAPKTAKSTNSRKEDPGKGRKRHDERCPDCKKVVGEMLREIYGGVEKNYRLEASTNIEDYKGTSFFNTINKIFSALQNHRGHRVLVRTKNLPHCDFFVPDKGFIVEFDELQHFTLPRMISLQNYPKNFKPGFSIKSWIALCEEIDSKDNDPPFRDEQRAWYDTLRDLLPLYRKLKPTVRLYATERQWCSLNPKNPGDVSLFKHIIEMDRTTARNWVATVLIQSDENYTNRNRLNALRKIMNKISEKTEGDGVTLFPGGWFSAGSRKAKTIFGWTERNVKAVLKRSRRNLIACLGIDGRKTDEWAKDQIGAAISRKGIIAIGRKFHPAPSEKEYVQLAPDHIYKEEGYSRIFESNGRRYFLCACYDSFGLKHKDISNFGIDVVLDLVHGFFPKGDGRSGDVYFAKHGFAGGSKHWSCPFFGAAVFFHRKIPNRWPSGVLWNRGKKNPQKWRYDDNPMKPLNEFELKIDEGNALVRIFEI